MFSFWKVVKKVKKMLNKIVFSRLISEWKMQKKRKKIWLKSFKNLHILIKNCLCWLYNFFGDSRLRSRILAFV